MSRQIKFAEAIREATDLAMARDLSVYLIGLGVPDPKGIFGTTGGLQERYGAKRVLDMPLSENAMTGVVIGSALTGMRPIITHQRVDFSILAMEQMVNQAAKWHYMFDGKHKVPMVVRMIIGRGWGQGPQHSQSLQSWFAHVPGLIVAMPTTAHDAKGMLLASIENDNPVIFLEHRWLHNIADEVPGDYYTVPLGKARIMRGGTDVTLVASSYMSLEALRAAEHLAKEGISAEVIDLRTIRPWDVETVLTSVKKTGRLVTADTSWKMCGVASEVVATVTEEAFSALKAPPQRVTLPDCPAPTSPALAEGYFPRAGDIVLAAKRTLGLPEVTDAFELRPGQRLDVPDSSFQGPF